MIDTATTSMTAPTRSNDPSTARRKQRQSILVLAIVFIGIIYIVSLSNMVWLTGNSPDKTAAAAFPVVKQTANNINNGTSVIKPVMTEHQESRNEPLSPKDDSSNKDNDTSLKDAKQVSSRVSEAHSKRVIDAASNATQSNITTIPWPGRVDHLADSSNRIIILIATCPYLDMLDNLIFSMRNIHVTNFVVVPLDDSTFKVASKLYPENTVSIPPNFKVESNAEPALFGSKEFQTLTASRPAILSAFLRLYYTVFYSDTDTVWQSNPLDLLEKGNEKCDVVGMTDNPINGETCSCYLYFKPTPRSIALLDRWTQLIQTRRFQHDQAAFHAAYLKPRNETNIKLYEPDNPYFPNGKVYFEKFNKTQQSKVMMIHNNFVFGYEKKKERFIHHDLWHPTVKLQEMEYTC